MAAAWDINREKDDVMEHFVRRKNIEHYRKLLANTTDEAERRVIAKLLAAEEAGQTADATSANPPKGNP